MDNIIQPTEPKLSKIQQKLSLFSKTLGIKTIILILLISNLITGSVVYLMGYSLKTEGAETRQASSVLVENEKDKVIQLEKKVAELETQNRYLGYINNESAYLNLVPPEKIGDKLKIKLYYYNMKKDKEIADYIPCVAVLPVEREIPLTTTPIKDIIELLIKGELTAEERAQGFGTEFPHPDFRLLNINLVDNILTLTFTTIPSFTSGGSCRVGLLAKQISLTAKQFPEVEEVRFEPDSMFQP